MLQLLQLMSLVIGFEGFINGKVYVGIYTPKKEYGYVITENEIYLDTVYEKRLDTEQTLCYNSINSVYLGINLHSNWRNYDTC